LLSKVSDLTFYNENDKNILLDYLETFRCQLNKSCCRWKLIVTIEDLLDDCTSFDSSVLYHPLRLLNSLIHSDFWGSCVNHKEFFELYESLQSFELYEAHVLNQKNEIEEKLGITIKPLLYDNEWNNIKAQPLSHTKFVASIPLLHKHLLIYPKQFFENIKLNSVYIAWSFFQKNAGHPCTMLWWFDSNVDNNVYLSFPSISKSIHHELYHQAMKFYNDISERGNLRDIKDQFATYKNLNHETRWYANNYWRENVSEDQATVAEHMIRDHEHMKHRAMTDWILNRKMQLVYAAYDKLTDWYITAEYIATLEL